LARAIASLVLIGIVAYTSERTRTAETGNTTTGQSGKSPDTNVP
jgi:hypothetical protein